MKRTYIIIPALEPGPELCRQIRELHDRIPSQIVVVDDGSGQDYREIFERIDGMENCIVLHHGENRGKGQALKTGFRYVRESAGTECTVLCLDCDGQHLPQDGIRLLRTVEMHPDTLVLGGRDFSEEGVPWKSRLGNRISSFFFWLFSGTYLKDTQTGFRAFDGILLDQMLQIPGDRFEYETRVLLVCAEQGIPIWTEKIGTVYLNENAGTHFRPVKDSIRVMGVLFGKPGRFVFTSLLCALLDLFLFWLFNETFSRIRSAALLSRLFGSGRQGWFRQIAAATVIARVLSAAVNYILNRTWVFRGERQGREQREEKRQILRGKKEAFRYLLLCIGITAASAFSVYAVSSFFHTEPAAAKILCDGILFIFSYQAQKRWVFCKGRKDDGVYGR